MIFNRSLLDGATNNNDVSLVQSRLMTAAATTINFSFTSTPTDGNLMVLFCCASQSRSVSLSGWNLLTSKNGTGVSSRTFFVFWKIASSETNIYTVNYAGGGTTANVHGREFTPSSITLVGVNEELSSTTLPASSLNASINTGQILVSLVVTGTSSIGGISWSNSFGDKLPAGTVNTITSTALRKYNNNEVNQNTNYTLATTVDAISGLFKVT